MLEMPELWDTYQEKLLRVGRTSPRKRSVLQSTKLKGVGDLGECFDIRHGDVEFEVWLAGFWSCFGLVFSPYVPFPPF